MDAIRTQWRISAGGAVDLNTLDPSATPRAPGRAQAEAKFAALHVELAGLQDRLWAENRRSVLVVLQGVDASGKDGTIKHLFSGVLPQATRVTAFKEPTKVELAHDFLWRIHNGCPAAGEIGIFNRSHYEDVVVVRVRKIIADDIWETRYHHINHFESLLADAGTTVLKFFLHISRDEQRRRFEQRLARPDKRWKFRPGDLDDRKRWDEFQLAYSEAITATTTKRAPWYVVPADHKWYRNWVISHVVVETLQEMAPQYPDPPNLEGIEIP